MMTEKPFEPTFRWHFKVIIILLLLCTAAWGLLVWSHSYWPASYQRKNPPAVVTPWRN